MVLTKSELITSLQNEVRILLHLASKIDRDEARLPSDAEAAQHPRTPEVPDASWGPRWCRLPRPERSIVAAWTAAEQAAAGRDFDQTLAALGRHSRRLRRPCWPTSPTRDLRAEIDLFGGKATRGVFIVNQVLCGCAAYRTQLFLYLKACGREELSTMNLWAGVDAPAAV